MSNLIKNTWTRSSGEAFERAQILRHDVAPEGLDVDRVRFAAAGRLFVDPAVGNLISVIAGSARVIRPREKPLAIERGCHMYVPPGMAIELLAEPGAEMIRVASPSKERARGERFMLRDETFLIACTAGEQPLRWIFTPQYLSRRVFLRHDQTLTSKGGDPVSWFHTTMFDVAGLPPNDEGESVFKMSYNSRTEFNVLYEVTGRARVRMALHPYAKKSWGPWRDLDGDTTYHLDEAAGGEEEERIGASTLRNKHEVYARDGNVSLMCLFDPAPAGIEKHEPGQYSDYEPYSAVAARPEYTAHQREIARFDAMVDRLSIARAEGELDQQQGTPEWACFLEGKAAQAALEAELIASLAREGQGRDTLLARWARASV